MSGIASVSASGRSIRWMQAERTRLLCDALRELSGQSNQNEKENDMTNSPHITRLIGEAERTLQTLLQRQLEKAGMSFPEWVALTVLSGN